MSRSLHRRARDERGAFIVLWAFLVTGMMIMLAIVIDLGHVRASRRSLQSVSDLSALAGGVSFSTPGGLDPLAACQDTIRYINQNLTDMPAIDAVGFCSQSGKELNKTICNAPFTKPQANPSTVSGRYTVELHYPVPDSEIADASGVRVTDGQPCERLRVLISSDDKSFFAGLVGVNNLHAQASATIRRMPTNPSLVPALWLLEPTGCTSLDVNGSGTTVIVGTATVPGVVTIDSDGSTCNNNQYTLTSSGLLQANPLTGTGYDRGVISLFALPAGQSACVAPACNPAEVGPNIKPQPTRRDKRATRAPVDWRYDCKTKYPDYTVPSNPTKVEIGDCPNASSTQPYITNLQQLIGTGGQPSGFTEWTGSCNNPPPVMPEGNLWIRCNTFSVKTLVEFPGGNVVFDGDVSVSAGGTLKFNHGGLARAALAPACVVSICDPLPSSPDAAIFYMRKGNLSVTGGGSFDLNHTFVYEAGGYLNFNGGGTPVWNAPVDGPFKSLAYWDEYASSQFQISGGASMSLGGVFFTPQAFPFSIAGGSPAVQQNAQFVSRMAKISGGGTLKLTPQQGDAVTLPPPAAILIR
jgi:hypothetical protein